MSESKPVTGQGWHDPDDGPELTEEILDVAEFAMGGRVIRSATGLLASDGVRRFRPRPIEVEAAAMPRALVKVYAQAGRREAMTGKTTGPKAAKAAFATLRSEGTGAKSKTAAASALSQVETKSSSKTTGTKAAKASSATLQDGRTAAKSKSAAGSALSQAKGKK